jgi:hypothetical protein
MLASHGTAQIHPAVCSYDNLRFADFYTLADQLASDEAPNFLATGACRVMLVKHMERVRLSDRFDCCVPHNGCTHCGIMLTQHESSAIDVSSWCNPHWSPHDGAENAYWGMWQEVTVTDDSVSHPNHWEI